MSDEIQRLLLVVAGFVIGAFFSLAICLYLPGAYGQMYHAAKDECERPLTREQTCTVKVIAVPNAD